MAPWKTEFADCFDGQSKNRMCKRANITTETEATNQMKVKFVPLHTDTP